MSHPKPDTATKTPKLAEVAKRIQAHLKRMEMAQADHGSARPKYWNSCSYETGSRVAVVYISFQGRSCLTKAEALKYLIWLDTGNEGRHYQALRETADAN